MLGHIIRKEISANLSSPTFLGTFVFCFILILLSLYTGLRSYSDQVVEHGLTQTLSRENLGQQTDYRAVSGMGVQLSKPPEALGVIVSGLENSMGRHTSVSRYSNPTLAGSKIEGNPIFAVFGDLDLMFIVKTVLSLLAILFTYNALSGEKEDGTLRLTLSHPVPRDTLILGKMIGGFLCLVIPLSIPLLLGIALLTLFPNIHLAGGDWVRLSFIIGVFLLYLALFFTLGMFVSARTSRSAISFLALLFIWVVCVLVIPKGSVILASQFVQAPSLQEHRMRGMQVMRDISRKAQPEQNRYYSDHPPPKPPQTDPGILKEKRDALMADFNQARTEWQKKYSAWMKDYWDGVQAKREAEQAKLDRAYQNRQERLADLAVGLSRISPASALTYASMNLAGTGIEGHDHFLTSARAYKEKFVEYVDRKLAETGQSNVFIMAGMAQRPPDKPVDISDMPIFHFQREPLSDTLGRITVDLVLMGLLTVVFFAGAYVSFLKYDVR